MISVETPRLLLRWPEQADAEPFVIIHQDPEVLEKKQVTRLPPQADGEPLIIHQDPEVLEKKQAALTAPTAGIEVGLRNVRRMLRHWEHQGYGQWAVVEKSSGQVIGCVGLFYTEGWPGIDLNWILHRSRWGHGFATEASLAALQWAWDANIDHIISLIAPDDLRSIRVATKIGERFERADADPVHGEPVHVYGIHRPEAVV